MRRGVESINQKGVTLRKRISWLFAGVLAIALIAVGCGGGSDNTSSTSDLTKAEFIAKANAICAQGNKEIQQAFEALGQGKPSQAQLDQIATDTLLPSVEKQVSQIRDLGIPKGEEDQVNAILDSAQSGIDKGKADPSSLVSDQNDPFKEANQLAKQYGMTECGGG
ncbi:MAG: hypothetical protein ACXWEL_06905 [Solirubrobacterales bacterium]